MKKIAWITANIGGIDTPRDEAPQLVDGYEVKRIYVTEYDAAVTGYNAPNPRMAAKWYKCQGYKLPEVMDCEIICWTDANIELKPGALQFWVNRLNAGNAEILVQEHHHRKTMREEADFIYAQRETDRYLAARYAGYDFEAEMKFWKNTLREDAQLLCSNVFIYVRTNETIKALSGWWNCILRFGHYDQFSLSAILYKDLYSQNLYDGHEYYNNPYFTHHNHRVIM